VTEHPDPLAPIAALPLWEGRPRFDELPGGISNVSYVATDRSARYVVRLTRDFPFHDVYREREVAVARRAHAAGFSPEIVFAAPGVMISRFIDARTLDAASVRGDIERIATLVRRFHHEMTSPSAFRFDVFAVNGNYLRQLAGIFDAARLAEWHRLNEKLARLSRELPGILGHHDLLPANFLDDGSRLWLIDFEYAGRGNPLFDLANLSSNAQLSGAEAGLLLSAYFGHEPDDALRASHRMMEAASLLREGLWSLVSRLHIHERNVDYAAYAELNFARMQDVLRTVDLA
jgi:thiamine kinase-like enzyme